MDTFAKASYDIISSVSQVLYSNLHRLTHLPLNIIGLITINNYRPNSVLKLKISQTPTIVTDCKALTVPYTANVVF